jgi:hypothetical protein
MAIVGAARTSSLARARADDLHDSVLYRWHDGALGGPLDAALGAWIADTG